MRRAGFFWKVFGIMAAAIVVAALVVYLIALPSLDRHYVRETERNVARETQLARAATALAWSSETQRFDVAPLVEMTEGLPETRFTLIAADGEVLFDNREDPSSMDNHAGRAEVRSPGRPVTRYSRTLEREMTYYALPVEVDGELRAYARVAVSVHDRDQRAAELRRALEGGAALAGLVALVLAFLFTARLTRPLREIAALVGEVGEGRPSHRLRVDSDDEVGRLAGAVNTMADQLQEKMERVERDGAEREAILSAMASGLLALDGEQRVLFVNAHARKLLALPPGPVKGTRLWELSRNVELADLLASCAEDGEPHQAETTLQTNGTARSVELSAVRLLGEGGEPRGFVLVLHDITELRRLEAVRRDFVSNVSHELKTPLTAMAGYLEAVLENPEMPDEQRRSFLSKANQNTDRLTAIVTDLLSLARLESEEQSLELETLSLLDVAEEAVRDSGDLAHSREITVEVEQDENEPLPVEADAQILAVAISNLLSNAIKYSPEGETVTLRLFREGEEAVLEVVDRGPGIAPGEQDRIFERFYRVDKARSRKLGGTGLGLAIVRHVMAAHHGRVELESAPGKGSTFRLTLPLGS